MAKALTPQDTYPLMNALVKEATGQADINVVDLSSFVSAGEKVLATGTENTLNALSLVLGRTFIAVRPYKAKLAGVQAYDMGEYSHRLRKISFYSRPALPAGDWNTQLYPENLFQGKTNAQDSTSGHEAVKSMWVQNQPQALEMNFAGQDVWDESTTVYEYQLKPAFRDPASFADFVAGIMTEKANDIESEKEAFNRITILNKIGSIMLQGTAAQKVNLTAAFNAKFGTQYTSEQLRTTYLKEFLAFFVSTFKLASDRMTERSLAYHLDIPKTTTNPETGVSETLHILRHTPKADQKALLYNPLFVEAQAQVMPQIFNPEYLNIDNFEGVDFWQSNYDEDARPAVNIYPAIYDTVTGTQIKGDQVNLPFVVGLLMDRDACLTAFGYEGSASSPLEARKQYRNIWWHFSKNAINDPTENAILFYMDDESEGEDFVWPEDYTETIVSDQQVTAVIGEDNLPGFSVANITLPEAMAEDSLFAVRLNNQLIAFDNVTAAEPNITATSGDYHYIFNRDTPNSKTGTVEFYADNLESMPAGNYTFGVKAMGGLN